MRFSWTVVYALLWIYRSLFSVVGQLFVAQLTSLGDSGRYQAANITILTTDLPSDPVGWTRVMSTVLTESIGGVFHLLVGGNPILINIGFQTIAFIGIVMLLRALEPRQRIVVLLLAMLPSFSVWSSVAGKEAVVVFALGIVLARTVQIFQGKTWLDMAFIPALCLVLIYKNQYAPALIYLLCAAVLLKRIRQKCTIALFAGFLSLLFLYLIHDSIGRMALEVVPHFEGFGHSTRPIYFLDKDDVFTKAPYGMFQAFFGPTLEEASLGILHKASFVESSFILIVLGYFFFREFHRLPVFLVIVACFTLGWILFGTYPLGIMNPGSAIRYRTGYELLVFVLIAVITSRHAYYTWQRTNSGRPFQASTLVIGPATAAT